MVRQTINRVFDGARRWARKTKQSRRNNRAWVLVVKGETTYVIRPSYYEQYAFEADQFKWRESPVKASERLRKLLFKDVHSAEVHYLRRYPLKGAATYNELHVCYVVIADNAELAPEIEEHMELLHGDSETASSHSVQKLKRSVARDLHEALALRPKTILQELRDLGLIEPH